MKFMTRLAPLALSATLALSSLHAQSTTEAPKTQEAKTESRPPAPPRVETDKTFYLTYSNNRDELNDIQTAIRVVLVGHARLYATPSENAIIISGTAVELDQAQQIINDLDRPKKLYRLTYTITESDNGKRLGLQHFAIVVPAGGKAQLKRGSRIPIVTGSLTPGSTDHTTVEYFDIGLDVNASLENYGEGVRLNSKVEQSSIGEEKSGVGLEDPVIRQTTLEGASILALGKPLTLGSLDIPDSTRHQEIEVTADLLH